MKAPTFLLAVFWSVFAACFMFSVVFTEIPEQNARFADTIIGFVLGTIVATILGFFFGSSQNDHARDLPVDSKDPETKD
jgi:ABC-type nitrate/sulfonate/bicarbonate transport system permease component